MAEAVKNDPVVFLLGALVTGFIAGFGAYRAILTVGAHEVVQKGSYILKSNVVGNLLKTEALAQIDHLIELGEKVDFKSKSRQADDYMVRVIAFIHYLDLPKDVDQEIEPRSFAEKTIDHIIRDIPNVGQEPAPLPEKVARIVGVLKGVRASLTSQAGQRAAPAK